MNSLNIRMSYDYVTNLISPTWKDIRFLIQECYFPEEVAVTHAIHLLNEKNLNQEEIMNLVCLKKDESIYPDVDILANKENGESEEIVNNKALFLVLNWIYENKSKFKDPLGAVEEVYSDFDYPEDISGFIRYMPSNEPDLGSLDLNLKRIDEKWKIYLENEKRKFS
jgi:hypothetical protein